MTAEDVTAAGQIESARSGSPTGTRIGLLGGFALERGGREVKLPPSAQRVLAFVALQRRSVQRVYVAGCLWPDSTDRRAQANLRSALWRLGRSGLRLVGGSRQLLVLDAAIEVDVRASERAARAVIAGASPDERALEALLAEGELLPDSYDDWVMLEREQQRQLRLRALDILCERFTRLGRFDEAHDAGLAAVAGDPLRESAHRALVRLHLAEGNTAAALRQYELCRRLLDQRLGVEPSPLMDALVQRRAARRAVTAST